MKRTGNKPPMTEMQEKLMDLAERHLRAGGYHSFSFRDLAAEAKIKSSSVHYHFPTKAELVAAIVRRHTERFLQKISDEVEKGEKSVVEIYRAAFRGNVSNDQRMCLGGVIAVESGDLPNEVTKESRQFFHRGVDDLASRIGGQHAKERALQIFATLEGGQILARAYKDAKMFDRATADL